MDTLLHPLRKYRQRHSLTLDAVASVVGVSAMTISRIETGRAQPSPDLARRLASLTGIAKSRFRPDLWESRKKDRAA